MLIDGARGTNDTARRRQEMMMLVALASGWVLPSAGRGGRLQQQPAARGEHRLGWSATILGWSCPSAQARRHDVASRCPPPRPPPHSLAHRRARCECLPPVLTACAYRLLAALRASPPPLALLPLPHRLPLATRRLTRRLTRRSLLLTSRPSPPSPRGLTPPYLASHRPPRRSPAARRALLLRRRRQPGVPGRDPRLRRRRLLTPTYPYLPLLAFPAYPYLQARFAPSTPPPPTSLRSAARWSARPWASTAAVRWWACGPWTSTAAARWSACGPWASTAVRWWRAAGHHSGGGAARRRRRRRRCGGPDALTWQRRSPFDPTP